MIKKVVLVVGLISLLISGCNIGPTRPNPSVPLVRYALQASDLPEGWFFTSDSFYEENGGVSYLISYQGSEDESTAPYLSQQLTVYPDEQSAYEAYSVWESQWFTHAWVSFLEADFIPADPSDMFRYGCMNVTVNGNPVTSSTYLQQHKWLISLVLVNIDNVTMNFGQFNEVLKKLDNRMSELDSP